MRRHLAFPILLAACLVASIASAANDRVLVTFESFAASGVSGEGTLNQMPGGDVQIHATLRGLEPNTEYVAVIYDQSLSCGEGTSSFQVVQFRSNPVGTVTWNQKVTQDLTTFESIGIRRVIDNSLQACAVVTQ